MVKMPASSITASSTIPRGPKVLVGSPLLLPSPTVYCAETRVDLASQAPVRNATVSSDDKMN